VLILFAVILSLNIVSILFVKTVSIEPFELNVISPYVLILLLKFVIPYIKILSDGIYSNVPSTVLPYTVKLLFNNT
jgi:hypothetical protein